MARGTSSGAAASRASATERSQPARVTVLVRAAGRAARAADASTSSRVSVGRGVVCGVLCWVGGCVVAWGVMPGTGRGSR